jgi:hypothetical protein
MDEIRRGGSTVIRPHTANDAAGGAGQATGKRPTTRPATQHAPFGLTARSRDTTAPLFSTENLAPRAKTSLLGKVKKMFTEGKSSAGGSLVIGAGTTATQAPSSTENKVQLPRFEGTGRITPPKADNASLNQDVAHATEQIGQENAAVRKKKSKLRQAGEQALKMTQLAAAALSISRGPTSQPADAVSLQQRQKHGSAPEATPDESTLLALDYLGVVAAGDLAKATAQLALQVDPASGEAVELQTSAQDITTRITEATGEAKGRAEALRTTLQADLAGTAEGELRTRLDTASQTLFTRLDAGSKIPDIPASEVLALAGTLAFGAGTEVLADALEGLSQASPQALLTDLRQALTSADALDAQGQLTNPVLRLAASLVNEPGGARMLKLMLPSTGADAKQQEALQVGLSALAAFQEASAQPGGMDDTQKQWLSAAVTHATGIFEPAAVEGSTALENRQLHIAYRGVQNGFVTNGPGSPYERVSQRLAGFQAGELEQTARRNARAAGSRFGRLVNWATGGMPKPPEALSALPGSAPTVWRKSAMRQLTKAAVANGMLPSRNDTVASVHRTSADIRAALEARPEGAMSPAESLLIGVLDALKLGTGGPVPGEASLKHLGHKFFDKVEAQLGAEGMAALPAELREEWAALNGQHPNAGHLLKLLSAHVDVHALLNGEAGTEMPPEGIGQAERGKHSDQLARAAVQSFAGVAQACRAAAPEDAEIRDEGQQAFVSLMEATAKQLDKATGPAALQALRIETFEAIENQLARKLRDSLPEDQRPTWQEAREQALQQLPEPLQAAWVEMKTAGTDAGRLMRRLTDEVQRTMANQPLPAGGAAAGEGAPRTVRDALKQAEGAMQAMQRDVHAERFEQAVNDAVTLYNDVRSPRDAAAVMDSMTQRVSLGEKLKNSDARFKGLDLGKMTTLAFSLQELVSPIVGGGRTNEQSMEINMNGAAMQMWLGETNTTSVALGIGHSVRGELGHDDHQFNLGDEDEAGLALRLDLRMELGAEWSSMAGVSMRLKRAGGQEDQLRREFSDVMADLVQPQTLAGGGEPYPDMLAAMLDRHPKLSLAELAVDRQGFTSEVTAALNLTARFKGDPDASADERKDKSKAVGIGVAVGLSSKAQRQSQTQTESGAALGIEESKKSAKQNVDFRAGAAAVVSVVPGHLQKEDGHNNVMVRGAGVDYRKQLTGSAVDTNFRIVTLNGETWADQSQMIREFENLDEFLRDMEPRQHDFVTALAGKDSVADAPPGEKAGRAWERLQGAMAEAREHSDDPNLTYTMVCKLRPEAAKAFDAYEAKGRLAERAGHLEEAAAHRRQGQMLLSNDAAWVGLNLQVKSKAKSEKAQGLALGVLQGKAGGEATKLHEFVPAGAGQVGARPNIEQAAPADHSGRWALPDDLEVPASESGESTQPSEPASTRPTSPVRPTSPARPTPQARPATSFPPMPPLRPMGPLPKMEPLPKMDPLPKMEPLQPMPPFPPMQPFPAMQPFPPMEPFPPMFPEGAAEDKVSSKDDEGSDHEYKGTDSEDDKSVKAFDEDEVLIEDWVSSEDEAGVKDKDTKGPGWSDGDNFFLSDTESETDPTGGGQGKNELPRKSLKELMADSPEASPTRMERTTTLKDLLDQPPPASPPRAASPGKGTEERWYDVPAWEDPAKAEAETQESLSQWRQALREGKAGATQPAAGGTQTTPQTPPAAKTSDASGAGFNAGLSDDAALQEALAKSRLDTGGTTRPSRPLPGVRIGEPTGEARHTDQPIGLDEGKGKGKATASSEASSEEDPFDGDIDDLQRRLDALRTGSGSSGTVPPRK